MSVGLDRRAGSTQGNWVPTRRAVLTGGGASLAAAAVARAEQPFRFGLTPVFLTSDLQLLEALQHYLTVTMGVEVQLVLKRTYQEITSQLLSGLLDAAWIWHRRDAHPPHSAERRWSPRVEHARCARVASQAARAEMHRPTSAPASRLPRPACSR